MTVSGVVQFQTPLRITDEFGPLFFIEGYVLRRRHSHGSLRNGKTRQARRILTKT